MRKNVHLRRRQGIGILLFLALAVPFLAFSLYAFSFRWFFPQLIPQTWTLRAWQRILAGNFGMLRAGFASISLAGMVTTAALLIGLPASRALGLYRFRFKKVVEFLVLAPAIVPPVAIGMGLSVLFSRLGLSGTWTGVALVHLIPVLPYVILTLAAAFSRYDTSLEDQARTLGAGPLQVFFYITLPTIFPAVMVSGLFAFLISFSQYTLTMLIGAGRIITLPILLFSTIPGGDIPAVSALSIVFVLPSLFILMLTARYLAGHPAETQKMGRI
ncbi:MAG: ABC transporter permease [Spirochaetes bacterium]|nr:ABC transporter permease [Spirochaetota bacterium]